MAAKRRPTAEDMDSLLTEPHFGRPVEHLEPSDPIAPMPMVVAVDEIDVYEHNPRISENEKYEDIKASIQKSGRLGQALTISRRPGSERYIISEGGNTRLRIVKELWASGDARFREVQCVFQPWEGDTKALLAHLVENDLRGNLLFIDRARGVSKLRAFVEEERGQRLSLRELSEYLDSQGYKISPAVLVSINYAIESLVTAIPVALRNGLSRNQAERIRKLHKAFVTAWEALEIPDQSVGESLFLDLLTRFDGETIDLEAVYRAAINELSVSADCDVQTAAMMYEAAVEGRELPAMTRESDDDSGVDALRADEEQEASPERTKAPTSKEVKSRSSKTEDLVSLRKTVACLAQKAAAMLGCEQIVIRIDSGLGFRVEPIPRDVFNSVPEHQRDSVVCAWWMLATVSEQHSSSAPAGEAAGEPGVPTIDVGDFAARGLHQVNGEFYRCWCDLVESTREIYAATKGQPWT